MTDRADWFDPSFLSPHGFCLSWQPGLLSLHAISDLTISLCYIAVGGVIFTFGRRRPDMGPGALYNSLAIVFGLCGLTHLSEIVVLWHPLYVEQGLLKAFTAVASLPTLVIILKLMPHALKIASPAQLAEVNQRLNQEIAFGIVREERLVKLSMALEQSPAMVVITDTEGVIEYVNAAFTQISGYPADEVLGRTPSIVRSENTPHEMHDVMWRALSEGREWRGEMEDCRKDGQSFWVSVSISPIRNDIGAITHFVAVEMDITERKLAEQQMADARALAEIASKAKTEILANMSHELRTPLNAIIGFSDTVLAGIFGPMSNDKQREYLDDIKSSGIHLLTLINDVLDVAAIEAGRLELHEDVVELGELMMTCIRLVEARAEKGEVQIMLIPGPIPRLRADERRIKQVVLNLLSNAVKFTPKGGKVQIEVDCTLDGDLDILVRDNGIGMSSRDLQKAKEPFGQVDSTLQRRYEGTGLGLPLSISLVEEHGGQVFIDSAPGFGTTVTVQLPASRIERDGKEQSMV